MSLINFFANLSFKKEHDDKAKSGHIDSSILSKLNLEVETEMAKHETRFGELRDELLSLLMKKHVIALLFIGLILLSFLTTAEIGGMYLVIILMSYMFLIYYPQMKEHRGYSDLNQELPYALRHMSIELKAGRGLHDALITIKNANYGSLSREFYESSRRNQVW